MKFLRVLPLYAMSALLALGLALLAAARDWSGGETVAAGAVTALFFLAAVVAPWLVRKYGGAKRRATRTVVSTRTMTATNGADSRVSEARDNYGGTSVTVGEPVELTR